MKVQINNLGPIEQAEIEVRPLTVFVGPNNSGKTLTSYVLATIFGPFGFTQYYENISQDSPVAIELQKITQQLINHGNASIDVATFANDYGVQYINEVALYSRKWLNAVLSTERMSFENTSINIELGEMHSQFVERVIDTSNARKAVINKNGTVLNAVKEKGKREIFFFTSNENEEENDDQQPNNEKLIIDLPESVINNLVNSAILQMIHRALYRDAYAFPTERTTMISLPLISLPASETQSDNAPSLLVADSVRTTRRPMSAIIGKFISMIFAARQSSVVGRRVQGEKTPDIKRYMQLADIIEQKILGGSVVFSKKTPETERDVLFRASKKVTIELPVASSMIKELSPLVLYLRFIARPNDLVIIDEPEMNLHPEAQVKLTEVLSMMAQANLKVLITTHSPYVVDHLTNLIKASKTTNLKKAASQFFLKDQTAFIEHRLVSVYLFENATAENILQEDGLVNWETFGSISSRVSQIFFDI